MFGPNVCTLNIRCPLPTSPDRIDVIALSTLIQCMQRRSPPVLRPRLRAREVVQGRHVRQHMCLHSCQALRILLRLFSLCPHARRWLVCDKCVPCQGPRRGAQKYSGAPVHRSGGRPARTPEPLAFSMRASLQILSEPPRARSLLTFAATVNTRPSCPSRQTRELASERAPLPTSL